MTLMLRTNEELLAKLKSKTMEIGGCWLWQGKLDSAGYGRISFRGIPTRIHRASAYLFLGFNLEDKIQQVNHKFTCNTNCWNPEHLYVGDKKENAVDRILMEGKNTCPQGHIYDMVNSRGKRDCLTCRRESVRKHREKHTLPTLPE